MTRRKRRAKPLPRPPVPKPGERVWRCSSTTQNNRSANAASRCLLTGENDSDQILTQGLMFYSAEVVASNKAGSLLWARAGLRRLVGSGSGVREKFTA